ncbi:MAG: SsrA-binding protein SmpB [Candidatus Campbellbacteria bacterium]|nr:SsrA-binding protein SmpB [Candidatus Campbellbacteria bacterium]
MVYLKDKKTLFDYEVLESIEAGIELRGFEVKAIKKGMGSLKNARCLVRGGEAFVVSLNIPPFQKSNAPKSHNPSRTRRLLLKKPEILKLLEAEKTKGLTSIIISVYSKGALIKVEIGIVRRKKGKDKREIIKKRDSEREARRTIKNSGSLP